MERRSEVNSNFTSSGNSRSARYQTSPTGSFESGNHGESRVLPQTFSRGEGARRTGLTILHDELMDAVEASLQFVHRSGVGKADMLLGTEGFTRNHGDLRLGQQPIAELQRIADAVAGHRLSHVGVSVKCAARLGDLHTRNLPQPLDYEVAPAAIFGQHDIDRVLRAAQCFNR